MFQLALGVAAVVILLDQLSKWLILDVVMQPPRVIPVTDFFNLVLTFNTGVSFGLFSSESDVMPWILSALALAIVGFLLFWLRRHRRPLAAWSVGLIVGGAIGNVIDRARFAAVVDFLDFHLAGWHWPAFNVADSGIVIGVGLLLIDGLFPDRDGGK